VNALGGPCLLATALLALGCAHAARHEHAATKPIGLFIDEDRIQRSGGATAWEVLKREAPVLTYRENRYGQPARFERRGRASILLDNPPMVFVDGVRMSDFKVLDELPVSVLRDIWVLSGIDGTTYYGTDAVSGVILVRTKQGPSQ
jgi:outer membrane cobalamin receptor